MMGVLRISLFGEVRVAHEGVSPATKVTRTVQGLLAYLLLYRQHAHPREVLADLFWSGHPENRARSCLNTALWRLRNVLEPEGVPRGTYLLTTPASDVGFNCGSPHWLDVEVFEEAAGRVVGQPIDCVEPAAAENLENGLALYTTDLLEGFYDDWALRERERLRMLHLNSLSCLMRYYRHHRAYERSQDCGQQILQHDPLREEIHRELMRLYMENGQRALAVRQYETCCEILAAELGVPPMEETQALYAQIVPEAGPVRCGSSAHAEAATLRQVVHELRLAAHEFGAAHEQLRQAIRLLERLTE